MNILLCSLIPTSLIVPSIWYWGPWALLGASCLLLLVGIYNVLSSVTTIRKRYSNGLSKGLSNLKPAAGSGHRHSPSKGASRYAPIWFCALFAAGMIAGHLWPRAPKITLYGQRIEKIHPPDSMTLHSPSEGTFRADFCPDNHIEKYLLRPGHVFCRLEFTDRGCMDIAPGNGRFTLVKNRDENASTAILTDQDTFRPWPDCLKDDFNAKGD